MQNLGRDFGLFRDLHGRVPREAALGGKKDLGQLGGFQGIHLQFPGMLCPDTESEAGQRAIPSHLQKELLRTWEQGLDPCSMEGIERPCTDMQGWRLGSQEALPGLELVSTCS